MKVFFVLAAAALIASLCCAAFAQDAAREPRYARGEAVVLLRVEEIRASDDRRALFAAYCREVAADAGAEAVYISPVYETSECATATFRSKLETKELIKRLKDDARVAGASPNYIMKLSRPAAAKD
mgnify:CR=1 FL=1